LSRAEEEDKEALRSKKHPGSVSYEAPNFVWKVRMHRRYLIIENHRSDLFYQRNSSNCPAALKSASTREDETARRLATFGAIIVVERTNQPARDASARNQHRPARKN
jgi:hypothetical protein